VKKIEYDFSSQRNNSKSLPVLLYSKIIPGYKGFYSVSNKTSDFKIGLQLYNLW